MLEFDYKNVKAEFVGEENGLNIDNVFNEYNDKIARIITDLNSRKDKPGQWLQWMNLGYSEETVWLVKEYAAMTQGLFENILVLGIGGSALGGMAVCEALLKPYWNFLTEEQRKKYPRIFFLDNVDPDQINGLLDVLNLKKTLVNVITKSGSTAETMSQFMVLKNRLQEEIGDNYVRHIVSTTDKNAGENRRRVIGQFFEKSQKKISPEALNYLQEVLSGDAGTIANELEKLSCFVGNNPIITINDCEAIVSRTTETVSWDFTNAVVEGNVGKALLNLGTLLEPGDMEMRILSLLSNEYQKMIQTHMAMNELGLKKVSSQTSLMWNSLRILSMYSVSRHFQM